MTATRPATTGAVTDGPADQGSDRALAGSGGPGARAGASAWVRGVVLLGLVGVLGLGLAHAVRSPGYAGDDRAWVAHASHGLADVWATPSPFGHYRPLFGSWLLVVHALCGGSPRGIAIGGFLLYVAVSGVAYWAFRPLFSRRTALLAATLLALCPTRHEQLFWVSAGIDTMCLGLSILCVGAALRALGGADRGHVVTAALAVGVTTALAVWSKEIALALPLIVLLLPGATSVARRGAVAAAAAGGAIAAAAVAYAVLGGLGRGALLLANSGAFSILLYPLRLVWPEALAWWLFRLKAHHDPLPLLLAGLFAAVVVVAIGAAFVRCRRDGGHGAQLHAALLLCGAGWVPWLVRQDDRSIGLGVVGLSLLLAAACSTVPARHGARVKQVVPLLVLMWLVLWIRWEARWLEAARVSVAVVQSTEEWRREVGADRFLVALGGPSVVGWGCEAAGAFEADAHALDLLGLIGPVDMPPVALEPSIAPSGIGLAARGDTFLRWGVRPSPDLGVVAIDVARDGYPKKAVFDPIAAGSLASRRGLRGIDVRVWDGNRFVAVRSAGPALE